MSDDMRHVMFADCFHEISDRELQDEHGRVLALTPSSWRTAVLREMADRELAPLSQPTEDEPRPRALAAAASGR